MEEKDLSTGKVAVGLDLKDKILNSLEINKGKSMGKRMEAAGSLLSCSEESGVFCRADLPPASLTWKYPYPDAEINHLSNQSKRSGDGFSTAKTILLCTEISVRTQIFKANSVKQHVEIKVIQKSHHYRKFLQT